LYPFGVPLGFRLPDGHTEHAGLGLRNTSRGCVIVFLFIPALVVATGRDRIAGGGVLWWWFAGPLIAASLHVCEEFVYPGGFRSWYASYRPEIASSLTARYLFVVNAIMLAVCALVAVAGPSATGAANWFLIMSILFWNAVFHVRAVLRTGRYSPGVITSLLLYIPLAILGSVNLLQRRLVPWAVAAACFGAGSLYHVFSLRNHQRRARRRSQPLAVASGDSPEDCRIHR